ncbi:MAG: hypothetical protein H7293_05200 [Candidatus Saccharibacteria bacterium]|nr:hypothetical protein [Rhodoferax sp.]
MRELMTVGDMVHANLDWLDADIVRYGDEALARYADARYADAAISAGKALESLCRQMIKQAGGTLPTRMPITLGDYSAPLKNQGWESAPFPRALLPMCQDAGQVRALLMRLEQAGKVRNKSAHGDSCILETTAGDALHIIEIVGIFVNWASQNLAGKDGLEKLPLTIKIFLSVGRPHRLDQKQFLEKLRSELKQNGVDLINLATAEYSTEKPLPQIRELMTSCDGALVIGWERVHAYTLFERESSSLEKLHQNIHIATPWNHIEGSMAATLGLPLFILKENRLHAEGIFEASSHDHKIESFDLPSEATALSPGLMKQILGWVSYHRKAKTQAVEATN